jgi:hypothetical protein
MKYILLLFIVYGYLADGSWILGARFGNTGLAYSEWGECQKFEGESRPCTEYDRNLMISISKLLNL